MGKSTPPLFWGVSVIWLPHWAQKMLGNPLCDSMAWEPDSVVQKASSRQVTLYHSLTSHLPVSMCRVSMDTSLLGHMQVARLTHVKFSEQSQHEAAPT